MDKYKDFAIDLAHQAGEIIKRNFQLGMNKEFKGDHSPVTETDFLVNKLVADSVHRSFPDHGIISEEDNVEDKKADFVWVCDPVDGTIPFSHGMPTAVFSLALVEDGKPIFGVVYDPFQDRMFYASSGGGAYLNSKKIQVSESKKFGGAVFDVWCRSGKGLNSGEIIDVLEARSSRVLRPGSIVYDGVLIAAGEFAGLIFSGTHPHDSATIKILVEEAGGKVTGLNGKEQRYDDRVDGCIAANKYLHGELLKIVQDLRHQ